MHVKLNWLDKYIALVIFYGRRPLFYSLSCDLHFALQTGKVNVYVAESI